MKTCSLCNTPKNESEYYKYKRSSDGYRHECKRCSLLQAKNWQLANSDKMKATNKKWKENNSDKVEEQKRKRVEKRKERTPEQCLSDKLKKAEANAKWYKENKEHNDAKSKEWIKNNKEKNRENQANYCVERSKIDPQFKLSRNIKSMIAKGIKRGGGKKNASSNILLECTYKEAYDYLESLFQEGMTWKNHGFGDDKWHIDHIIPVDSFDLTDLEEQKKCFNYKNLQPLWQPDNFDKSNKLNWTKE